MLSLAHRQMKCILRCLTPIDLLWMMLKNLEFRYELFERKIITDLFVVKGEMTRSKIPLHSVSGRHYAEAIIGFLLF